MSMPLIRIDPVRHFIQEIPSGHGRKAHTSILVSRNHGSPQDVPLVNTSSREIVVRVAIEVLIAKRAKKAKGESENV